MTTWTGTSVSDITRLPLNWAQRIEVTRVDTCPAPGDCWLWQGGHSKREGYGRVYYNGRTQYTHRVIYEVLVGPIPDGLYIDHLCRQRACCAPHHLEPVTNLVNIQRGMRANMTHCLRGHPLSGENIRIDTSQTGRPRRVCKRCRANLERRRRADRRNSEARA